MMYLYLHEAHVCVTHHTQVAELTSTKFCTLTPVTPVMY